jgi:glutamate transport system permease protein
MSSVLFDVPGPKSRRRHRIGGVVSSAVLLALSALVLLKLYREGVFALDQWEVFVTPVYMVAILEGTLQTLLTGATAILLAVPFGALFGIGRLSDRAWVRWPCVVVVEFFRAVPLLVLILVIFLGWGQEVGTFWSLVLGLTLYNGSVLAEVFRAGILAVPKGQAEAGYSIGLRKSQVTRLVLLPQAVRIMLPAIISQCVVVVKDTALGFIILSEELASVIKAIYIEFDNIIPAAIVASAIYITINASLSALAHRLEARTRRAGGEVLAEVDTGAGVAGA